jgi:demethylmenaquinone methyltransferase/2-methoxy-6-polyprenyl-1,4-benzoquinol methylase
MKAKAAYVRAMFADIADTYDFLNRVLSFHRDRAWRKFAVSKCGLQTGGLALDVATGTGELALEMAKRGKVIGIDFCRGMLHKAKNKNANNVDFALGMAESLPFPDDIFDCVTIGFALRDVTDIQRTVQEMVRVTKTGGRVICLEFSQPSNKLFNSVYRFYLFYILSLIGTLISRKKYAYTYLPQSIIEFLTSEELKQIMEKSGLKDIQTHSLSQGIAAVHTGIKEARCERQ